MVLTSKYLIFQNEFPFNTTSYAASFIGNNR